MKRIYRFSCGCIVEGVKKSSGNTVYCMEHPDAHAVARVFECVDCGKTCEGPMRSNHLRCRGCSAAKQKKDKQEYYQTHVKGKAITNKTTRYYEQVYRRNEDCFHYPECMSLDGELFKDPRACAHCARYTPVPIQKILAHELELAVA